MCGKVTSRNLQAYSWKAFFLSLIIHAKKWKWKQEDWNELQVTALVADDSLFCLII